MIIKRLKGLQKKDIRIVTNRRPVFRLGSSSNFVYKNNITIPAIEEKIFLIPKYFPLKSKGTTSFIKAVHVLPTNVPKKRKSKIINNKELLDLTSRKINIGRTRNKLLDTKAFTTIPFFP